MDESMEEGDSLFSIPASSNIRPRALYQTPPQLITTGAGPTPGVGLGFHSSVVPQELPGFDESFEQPDRWVGARVGQGASPPDISSSTSYEYSQHQHVEEGVEEDEEGEGEEGSYEASESSSAQYDPDTDPEAFAQRLDELAGTREITPQELKARSWGLPLGSKPKKGADLPFQEFRKLVNHHLNSTQWKYNSATPLQLPLLGRQNKSLAVGFGRGSLDEIRDFHPIRVLGRGWTEKDEWLEMSSDDMEVEGRDGL